MRASRTTALAILLLAAPVAAGQAQIGGALKKAKEAATGKSTQTVDKLPCDITYEELDALQKGLEAELAAAANAQKEAEQKQKEHEAEQKAYEKAQADYEKSSKSWNACRDKVLNDPTAAAKADSLSKKSERDMQQAGNINQNALEAKARQAQEAAQRISNGTGTAADRQTVAEFQQMMAGISSGSQVAMATMGDQQALSKEQEAKLAKCGAEPQAPKQPGYLDFSPERVILDAGRKAANMDENKYRAVRDCAIKSQNLRLSSKAPDADRMNQKLDQVQKTMNQMRAQKVPI